jgi:predicted nucleotidyltransferase
VAEAAGFIPSLKKRIVELMRAGGDRRDRDFIETREGLLFTVVGNIHPPGRTLAYLKYYPAETGRWSRLGQRFERAIKYYDIPHLKETIKLLSSRCPNYIRKDPFLNIVFPAVPEEEVKVYYFPEGRLKAMSMSEDLDLLQRRTVDLARLLSKRSGVSLEKFGVTGSVLVGVHQKEFSDIDLIIYGKRNSHLVKTALQRLFTSKDPQLRRLNGQDSPTPARQSRLRVMNEIQRRLFYARKWNRGEFMGTPFSVNPVLEPEDHDERYGLHKFSPIGIVEAKAVVVDDSESIFLPARYRVSSTEITMGYQAGQVKEIVCYDRDYGDVAVVGETVAVRGKLERVEGVDGGAHHHRIVVGTLEGEGADYLKVSV